VSFYSVFVQTLESPKIKSWDFQAWKVLEKGIGAGKPRKSLGILKYWSLKFYFLIQVLLLGEV